MIEYDIQNTDWSNPVFEEYATDRQKQYIKAMQKHGNQTKAAKELNVSRASLQSSLKHLMRRSGIAGYRPEFDMTRPAPEGFYLKGVSQYYNKHGEKSGEWRLLRRNAEEQEAAIRAFVTHLATTCSGLAPAAPIKPSETDEQIAVIPLGDAHVGLLTWAQEVGEDFNLESAIEITKRAIDRAVGFCPNVEEVFLINLGDFFHANGNKNVTPQSGNFLDVSDRWAKVYTAGIELTCYMIEAFRRRGQRVRYRANPGNHDPEATLALTVALNAFYNNADDVIIETAITAAYYYRYGNTLIGTCHGDGAKMDDLASIMAFDRKVDWGETEYRYWYIGHFHHRQAKEYRGCEVESFNTLAPTDAWHKFKGYRSKRSLTVILIDKHHGEVSRYLIDARTLR